LTERRPRRIDSTTFAWIGDYSGIAATDGAVFPVWTDLRFVTNREVFAATGKLAP